jgi:hypothetical protein
MRPSHVNDTSTMVVLTMVIAQADVAVRLLQRRGNVRGSRVFHD